MRGARPEASGRRDDLDRPRDGRAACPGREGADLEHPALLPAPWGPARRPFELIPPAAALESRTIHEGRPAARQSDGAELRLLPQHTIHRRARRAGHRRDVLLRQRHDAVLVRRRELDETAADASLRIDVVRLDDAIRRAAELLREEPQEHVLHAWVLALEQREVVAEDGARLSGLERLDRGRATRVGEQKRQLAEALAGTEDVDEHAVAERRQDARAEAAADDEVERVGGIVTVEDDLAARERPAAGDREQPANVLRRADRRAAASPRNGQSGSSRPPAAAKGAAREGPPSRGDLSAPIGSRDRLRR